MSDYIQFVCDQCDKQYKVLGKFAGRMAKCTCGHRVQIPKKDGMDTGGIVQELPVSLAKAEHGEPDEDCGSASISLTVSVTNPTEVDIELLLIRMSVLNEEGFCVAYQEETSECSVSPGETEDIELYGPYLAINLLGKPDKSSVKVEVLACELAFTDLGLFDVPEEANSAAGTQINTRVGSAEIESVAIWHEPADDDGEKQLKLFFRHKNLTEYNLPQVAYKAILQGHNGRAIEETSCEEPLNEYSQACSEVGFWGVKEKTLKKAKVSVQASVFSTIASGMDTRSGISEEVNEW